jgi:uncharacterized protein
MKMRIVVDTGVAVSAVLLPRSVPRQAIDAALAHGQLLVSEETIAELDEVLRRTKFNQYVSEQDRLEFLAALVQVAEHVKVVEAITDCRDPKDNKFLELAVSGGARQIITGDEDLLVLHPFRDLAIVTPQAFLAGLRDGEAR